jgi:putative SOS response-associated peptidase YedK
MTVDEAPPDEDDSIRHTYNFAPGNHGLVYRAEGPDHRGEGAQDDTKYKLQAMKWGMYGFIGCLCLLNNSTGLVPFWTKRNPDYGSMIKTINCRDDSLSDHRGMWTSMKKTKRCIVVAQGFYEWLKKNNGKERLPHFTKRKDGQLMCFAGLWDCVQYEGQHPLPHLVCHVLIFPRAPSLAVTDSV